MTPIRIAAWLILAGILVQSAGESLSSAAETQVTGEPPPAIDWITAELRRCRALREKAATDEGCHAANKANFRRFMGEPRPYVPTPVKVFHDPPEGPPRVPAERPAEGGQGPDR